MEDKLYGRASDLASRIIRISQNTLLLNLRFMDSAIFRLTPVPALTTFATDGIHIYYGIEHVLGRYKADQQRIVRDILHMTLHCIFRHSFVKRPIDPDVWDLASDIAVENMIVSLGINQAFSSVLSGQKEILDDLRSGLKSMNAETIYRYYMDQSLTPDRIRRIRSLFISDDHSCWYDNEMQVMLMRNDKGERVQSDEGNDDHSVQAGSGKFSDSSEESTSDTDESSEISASDSAGEGSDISSGMMDADTEREWEDVSKQILMDLESFSKDRGDTAGTFIQQLRELNRERYNYSSFLKKFAVMTEVMKVNDEEFDYIFYTYGLQLYGNLPLIEPLEYKDEKRIREFVIAIDTSGSVMGETVQRFVEKTYSILKDTESFNSKINVHIIQCDANIQEHVKITSQKEFDDYLGAMMVKGLGGTDFRPVFEEIDSLIAAHEFTRLKGMIYFTDGYGVFPEKKPAYETAFVFLRDEYDDPPVPPWAIKLVLSDEEIRSISL